MNHGMSVKSTIVPLVFLFILPMIYSDAFSTAFQRSGKHLHSTESKFNVKERGTNLKQNNVSSEARKKELVESSGKVEEKIRTIRDLSLCPSVFCSCSQNEQYVNCFQVEVESRRRSDLDLSLSVPGPFSEQNKSFLFSSISPTTNTIVSSKEEEKEGKDVRKDQNSYNISMKDERIVEPYKLLVLRKNSFLQHLTKTVELKLKGGSIESIEKESFTPLTLLQSLDLSNNFIRNISKDTFSGLRSLQILNLSCNRIEELNGETFSHLIQLQHLELQYNCIKNISRESFHGLFRLRYLNLESNNIKMIEARTLIHLTRVTHLLMENNNLTYFDHLEILSPLIQVLDLSGNNLDHVPQGMHPFVRNLKLGKNSIRKILLDDWDNYGSITGIVLDHNLITDVQANSFAHLELLTSLSFLGNRLKDVPVNLPSNLRHLNLEGNEIRRLEKSSFRDLWILEHLQISHNLINFIDPNTFCDLLNLHSLHLEGNQIEHIGSIFQNLTRLELLDLSGNPLKKLSLDTFAGVKALKQLGLNNLNSIEVQRIDENAFSSFSLLHFLEVSNSSKLANEILSQKHLKHLGSLKSIDISWNNLTNLQPEFVTLCPNLQSVNILGNKWNCTGNQVDWIGYWIRNNPELFIHPLNVTCSIPISLSGYPLIEFGPRFQDGKDDSLAKSHIIINHLSGKSADNLSNKSSKQSGTNEFLEGLVTKKSGPSSLSSRFPSSLANTFRNQQEHQHIRRWSGISEKNGLKIGEKEENEMRTDTSNIENHSGKERMDSMKLRKSEMDGNVKRGRVEDDQGGDEKARSVGNEKFERGLEVRSMKSSLVVPSHSSDKTYSSWHNPVLILCFTSLIPLSLIILLVIQGMNERVTSSSSSPSVSRSNSDYVLYSASSQGDQISFVSSSYNWERDHQPLLLNHGRDIQRPELGSTSSSSSQQVHESLLDSSSSRLSLLDFPSCSYSTSFQRPF